MIDELRLGSAEAARLLLERYGSHIQRVVRQRLNRRLRTQFDSEDIQQAVWKSFFEDVLAVTSFETPDDLMAYLARVATNKVVDRHRKFLMTEKSNLNRERRIENDTADGGMRLFSADPTPSEVAIANEQWHQLEQKYPPHYLRVLRLRVAGADCVEIAKDLQLHERSVRRILRKLGDELDGKSSGT